MTDNQSLYSRLATNNTAAGTRVFRLMVGLFRFFFNAYVDHWVAAPAGFAAAVVSTFGAAILMLAIAPFTAAVFENKLAIGVNAVIAPLLAYISYLGVYYYLMFLKERPAMLDGADRVIPARLYDWYRVARYDYIAHVPSDIYLITLAGIMQATLEHQGMPIFWAVVTSQLVDDFMTFLKEPAIWSGAKAVVAWKNRAADGS